MEHDDRKVKELAKSQGEEEDWVVVLEDQVRKLQSGENCCKDQKVIKEGGKTLGGCIKCTRGSHGDKSYPELDKECFICKQKGHFKNIKVCLK